MKRLIVHPASRVLLIVVLVLWVSACENGDRQGKATPTPLRVPTPTSASILLGPQPCPAQVKAPTYWDSFVHPTTTQQVERVICGYLTGQPSLQAVVTVRASGT